MIYKNITREEYNKLPGINASRLKYYYESSLNGNYENSKPRTETPAMRFGTACHSMILEPEKFNNEYRNLELPINEKTGKEYGSDTKKAKDYILTLPKDKKYLTSEEYRILFHIKNNVENNKHAMKILNACTNREMALTWKDPETGIECKALLDFVGDKLAGDLKTCRDIPFREKEDDTAIKLKWELISNRNLLQFSFYFAGLIENGLDIQHFAVIFAKNNGNCDVLTALLSEQSLEYGRNMYNRAISNYIDRNENRSAFDSVIEI